MSRTKGILAAILAYTAWGPLAPLGAILLESTGPFTLSVIRAWGTLLLLTFAFGPTTAARGFRIAFTDRRVWYLGVLGMGVSSGAYVVSILFLEPTIAALMFYLSPIFVSVIARRRLHEPPARLFWPTIALTLLGGALAILEPSRGVALPSDLWIGVLLGVLACGGWTFYTVYLKTLGTTYNDRELTYTAFITSGVAYLVIAIPFERLQVDLSPTVAWQSFVYVFFPSFISFQLYSYAVRHAGAAFTSILLGIELASTAVFSYFMVDEAFGLEKAVGIGIVLLAVTGFLAGESGRSLPRTPEAERDADGKQAAQPAD